jgi:hypothetical protein
VSPRAVAIALALSAAACGDDLAYPFADDVQVSGGSPFGPGCNGAAQGGTNFPGLEVEPSVAVDPTDPRHLVAAWQQDRWSNGGSQGILSGTSSDGGATWTVTHAAFSRCAGAAPGSGGDYERASDPWVSIGPTGIVWQTALVFDNTTGRSAIAASRSDDGGATWGDVTVLGADNDADVLNDKDAVTADPTDPGRAFAVWDRITGLTQPTKPIGYGPAMLARAENGVWEPARAIYDPGVDQQTLSNIVVVLPDGTLVDVFEHLVNISSNTPTADMEVLRSTDHGTTWSPPVSIASAYAWGIQDPAEPTMWVRIAGLPAVAADPVTGQLYVVWEQVYTTLQGPDGIAMSTSTDGGLTWSAPVQVNQVPTAGAFVPAVAVAADGTVGVTYYDTRDAAAAGTDVFDAAAFLLTSHDHGKTWAEDRLTGPFDLRQSSIGDVYFLGDYEGLAASGAQLVPFFVGARLAPDDPTDAFVRPL